jgi:hypothetical protein
MAKDFADGERMVKRSTPAKVDPQNDVPQPGSSTTPSWQNRSYGYKALEFDTMPPIPQHFRNKGGAPSSNVTPKQPVLVANAATMGMGEFVMKQIAKRSPGLAAKAAGLSLVDGPLPVGELISIGLTAWTAYEIYQDWKKYQANARRAKDRAIGSEPLQMSNTSREGDNHVAKRIRAEAGRSGDPCKIWEAEMETMKELLKSTRNKAEIKQFNKELKDIKQAGKQLGCANTQKRDNEKRGDYGSIK